MNVDERKLEEARFHDFVRGKELADDPSQRAYYTSNKKFYAVAGSSTAFYTDWLREQVRGKRVLDYACGDGATSMSLAQLGAKEVCGIDISPVSIENCKNTAKELGVADRCNFVVMDAEKLTFEESSFDVIVCAGVLHHLDVEKAYPELARVLKPSGKVMCLEALGHNPVFQAYRERTPHLRTEWETKHIIRRSHLESAKNHFQQVDTRFFHLLALLAVPLRKTPIFQPVLKVLDKLDSLLLKLPVVKWQAWMVWFVLSKPIKKVDRPLN